MEKLKDSHHQQATSEYLIHKVVLTWKLLRDMRLWLPMSNNQQAAYNYMLKDDTAKALNKNRIVVTDGIQLNSNLKL